MFPNWNKRYFLEIRLETFSKNQERRSTLKRYGKWEMEIENDNIIRNGFKRGQCCLMLDRYNILLEIGSLVVWMIPLIVK